MLNEIKAGDIIRYGQNLHFSPCETGLVLSADGAREEMEYGNWDQYDIEMLSDDKIINCTLEKKGEAEEWQLYWHNLWRKNDVCEVLR